MFNIEFMSPNNLFANRKGFISAYQAVYSEPPYNESLAAAQKFGTEIVENGQRPGFHCVVARLILKDQIIGFACGFSCLPGSWWHDKVTQGLSHDMVEKWFSNAFEFVEFGVIPLLQGQGIGSQLHHNLLSNLDHQTAVLSVLQADIPAVHVYQAYGWILIRKDFLDNSGERPCTILGLDLEKYKSVTRAAG